MFPYRQCGGVAVLLSEVGIMLVEGAGVRSCVCGLVACCLKLTEPGELGCVEVYS